MKLAKVSLAAALALSALGLGGTAMARDHHNDRHDRGWHDNGRHHGWNKHRGHQVCRTVWRHHHRERVCHWVR